MEKDLVIVFATWHGQAEKIAQRIADIAAMHRVSSTLLNVTDDLIDEIHLETFAAAILVGSVHFGRHPKALTAFARRRASNLSRMPTGFVSVSGAACSLQGAAEAKSYVHKFVVESGWRPDAILSIAGAVPYSKYDFFTKTFMKYAARIAGRDSDTSRDYEYTDWVNVENFTREFLTEAGFQTSTAARSVR